MTTELEFYKETATEHVEVLFDSETGNQSHLAIFNEGQLVFNGIDKSLALALAARLVELSIELPETRVRLPVTTLPPDKRRTVRRLSIVDERLRELDQ